MKEWNAEQSFFKRQHEGLPAIDPAPYSQKAFDVLLKKAGLKQDSSGAEVPDPKNPRAPKR